MGDEKKPEKKEVKADNGGFAHTLLIIGRMLYIVLLLVIIYTAVQGALLIKDIRDNAHTRMENGEFPIPLGGVATELSGFLPEKIGKNVEFLPIMQKMTTAYEDGDTAEMRRQLTLLDAKLAEKGMVEARAVTQQLMAAVDSEDFADAEKLGEQLFKMLGQ